MTTKTRFAEYAEVRFRVSEFAGGKPYISTEENGPSTNAILDGVTDFLMILKEGTTLEETADLVKHLNTHVRQISIQRNR